MSYETHQPNEIVQRCRACGYAKPWHRQEPLYYRAEELEPGATQSVAQAEKSCPGWDPLLVTLAHALSPGWSW